MSTQTSTTPPLVEIRMLGGFDVTVAGRTVPLGAWRGRKAQALVKLLCLAPHHRLHREELLDLLWPSLDPRAAANNLRSALHAARRALEPSSSNSSPGGSVVVAEGPMVALRDEARIRIDVVEFERAAAVAGREPTPDSLRGAIELYAGDLLPEDRYEEWALRRREILHDLAVSLLVGLATHQVERRPREAIELFRRVVELDPAHEHAHVGLMRLYASTDQRRQALLQYERLRTALRDHLAAEPGLSSERLYAAILSGQFTPEGHAPAPLAGPSTMPATTPAKHRHNLPHPLTSFIGREHDIDRVCTSLAGTRLLTLVGPGGAGKTRLALEVARAGLCSFDDGVWFVELATVNDPAHVPQTVAAALGVTEQIERTAVEALVDHLHARNAMLVLDNCEHLVDACSALAARLLAACANVTVLATSREALRMDGELAWRVPFLDVPSSSSAGFDDIAASDAVRLFVARAQFVQPGFALTNGNAGAIAAICRQLDGLPLSIELAAARVPVLTVDELARRLGDALHLLVGGSRTAESRHQTLRATLNWSFDLLAERERRVFERAAVFAGGWTLDAIEEVAAGDPVARGEVLDLLASLVDKSLVVTQLGPHGRLRYRLLEPVRQYARERLAGTADEQLAHGRHARWLLEMAEHADTRLHGHEQASWLERLEADHDNMRAALEWSLQFEPEIAVRLAATLWRFWYIRGHLRQARESIDRAVTHAEGLPPGLRAKGLLAAGQIRTAQCEYDEARPLVEESLALMRGLDDIRGVCDALSILAMSLYNQSEFVRARRYVEENLELERVINDPWRLSRSLSNLAEMAYAEGDPATAERYWMECLPIDVGLGDTRNEAITLHNLGEVMRAKDDLVGARLRFGEALRRFREVDFLLGVASALSSLAEVMIEHGDPDTERTFHEALQVARALGHPVATATLLEMVGKYAARRDQAERAARMFGAADAIRRGAGAPLSPFERAKLEPWLTAARDDTALPVRSAWNAGHAAPIDARLDEAFTMFEVAQPGATGEPVAGATVAGDLTPREREIVGLLSSGLTNREIATSLGVARATADKHVGNILRKLGVRTRGEARAWAQAHRAWLDAAPPSPTHR